MLEESEGQRSRLRGERQGGRQRKRGSQVWVSDGDRPQRTQDILLNTWTSTRVTLQLQLQLLAPGRVSLANNEEKKKNCRGPMKSLLL